jgi:PIN domain nuclease of toxin-antitoxin system
MNLLLDTHTLIWFAENSDELSSKAKKEIENPDNLIHISIVSFWEIGIKISLNKLIMKQSFDKFIELIENYNFILIPILFKHTLQISKLHFYHKDPFDRLLAAQSKIGKLSIISKDECFDHYDIKRIW